MKLEIKIAGPKVHDVGYSVFLLKNAMNLALIKGMWEDIQPGYMG